MRHASKLIGVLVSTLLTTPVCAEKRVALIIGNSAYTSASRLANPINDAADMSTVIKQLGFQVIEGRDLTHTEMLRAVRRFGDALQGADAALFFYAGHGLQVGGANYLLPVDANPRRESDLAFEAVELDLVMRQMEQEAKTAIVFLDACRDNPLTRSLLGSRGTRSTNVSRGLSRIVSGLGTFIAFSTEPGDVAQDGQDRNSPFSAALVKHVADEGKDLGAIMIAVRNEVLNATNGGQKPWDSSSLREQFYFRPPSASGRDGSTNPGAEIARLRQQLAAVRREIGRHEPQSGSSASGDEVGELKSELKNVREQP